MADNYISTVNIDGTSYEVKDSTARAGIESANTTLSTVQTNLNNLEIGGRNLLLDTEVEKTAKNNILSYNLSDFATNAKLYNESQVIVSFEAKTDTEGHKADCYLREEDGTSTRAYVFTPTTSYARYVIEITPDPSLVDINTLTFRDNIYVAGSTQSIQLSATLYIRNVKLEKGNKATDWTPAPEDVDSSINTVATNLSSEVTRATNAENALSTAIDGKAPSSHEHVSSEITDLSTRIDSAVDTKFGELSVEVDNTTGTPAVSYDADTNKISFSGLDGTNVSQNRSTVSVNVNNQDSVSSTTDETITFTGYIGAEETAVKFGEPSGVPDGMTVVTGAKEQTTTEGLIIDSSELKIEGLTVFGKTIQDEPPTPSAPMRIRGVEDIHLLGANFVQLGASKSATQNGVTWTVNEDGSFSASGTNTGYTSLNIVTTPRVYYLPPNTPICITLIGSYTNLEFQPTFLSIIKSSTLINGWSGTGKWKGTSPNQGSTLYIDIKRMYDNKEVTADHVFVMVNIGTTALECEEFKGIQTVNLNGVGKNLLKDLPINKFHTTKPYNYKFKAGEAYTISFKKAPATAWRIGLWTEEETSGSGNWIDSFYTNSNYKHFLLMGTSYSGTNASFRVLQDLTVLDVIYLPQTSSYDIQEPMLCKQPNDLTYEPFTQYFEEIGALHGIGEYRDTLTINADGTGTITRNALGAYIVTGTETWNWESAFGSAYISISKPVGLYNFLCSHYPVSSSPSTDLHIAGRTASSAVSIKDTTNGATLDELKAFFVAQYEAGTPVTIWYEPKTASPTTEELTADQVARFLSLHTYKPTTTVLCDGETSITYTAQGQSNDVRLYFEEGATLGDSLAGDISVPVTCNGITFDKTIEWKKMYDPTQVLQDISTNQDSITNLETKTSDLDTRISALETPPVYGIQIRTSDGAVTRIDDAVGLTARVWSGSAPSQKSDFATLSPWKGIRKAVASSTGQVLAFKGDSNYETLKANVDNYQGTWFPKFYSVDKIETVDDVEYRTIEVSGSPISGLKVDPAFIIYDDAGNKKGEVDGFFMGATHLGKNSNGNYSAGGDVNQVVNTSSNSFASLYPGDFHTMHITEYEAVLKLAMVEFATLNFQSAVGYGITTGFPFSWSNADTLKIASVDADSNSFTLTSANSNFYPGMFIQFGTGYNNSTYGTAYVTARSTDYLTITVDSLPSSVVAGAIVTGRHQPVPQEQLDAVEVDSGYYLQLGAIGRSHSFLYGVFDFWGNIFSFLGGISRLNGMWYVNWNSDIKTISNPSTDGNGWVYTGKSGYIDDGYLKTVHVVDDMDRQIWVPAGVGAGSSTYYSDYCNYMTTSDSGVRVLYVGGSWASGSVAGPFYWCGYYGPSDTHYGVGSRPVSK